VDSNRRPSIAVAGFARQVLMLVPVVFLMLPVVVLFALYPGLFTLSRLAR
jgi:tight adherence protein C